MILERYYEEFWMKMKITDQYIRSILIFNWKNILVFHYELKTAKLRTFGSNKCAIVLWQYV